MNTYYMRHQAGWQYPITFGILIFGLGGIGYLLRQKGIIPDSELLIMGVVGGLFWLGFYLARRTAVADVAITVDDAGVGQRWLRQTMFSDKPDLFIRWEDMAEYMYEPGFRGPDIFRIRLTNGEKWRLLRYKSFKKDDFERFRADFSTRVERFNESEKANGSMIGLGKTSMETSAAVVVAVLLIVLMVTLPIVMMVKPDMVGLGALGIGYPAALLIVILIYTQRKRRREYEQRLSQGLPGAFHEK